MQDNNQDQQDPTRLRVRGTQDRVQIPQEKENRPNKPDTHQGPIQRRHRAPTNQRDRDPDHIRVPIQRPTLDEVCSRAPEPSQRCPERNRQHPRVAVDQARRTRKQGEIVLEVFCVLVIQVLRNSTGQEEDDDDGGSDPERAVQVGVSFEDVEEVGAWVDGRDAAPEDLVGVDVEELRVEVD